MTREYLDEEGRFEDATILDRELTQLRKLISTYPELDDTELAHRMSTSKRQVVKMRKLI